MAMLASIDSLARVLRDVGVESELEIQGRVNALRAATETISSEISQQRDASVGGSHHAARDGEAEIASPKPQPSYRGVGSSHSKSCCKQKDRDTRHLHEIETLSLKFRRSQSARAVLAGVQFHSCPRCVQILPERQDNVCVVCGQTEIDDIPNSADDALVQRDIKSRSDELREIIKRHDAALVALRRNRNELDMRNDALSAESEMKHRNASTLPICPRCSPRNVSGRPYCSRRTALRPWRGSPKCLRLSAHKWRKY